MPMAHYDPESTIVDDAVSRVASGVIAGTKYLVPSTEALGMHPIRWMDEDVVSSRTVQIIFSQIFPQSYEPESNPSMFDFCKPLRDGELRKPSA